MAKVFIEETTLTAIGDAIRGKEGTSDLVPVNDMATRISAISGGGGSGGYEIPDEAFNIVGAKTDYGNYDCSYLNYAGSIDWFLERYGDRVTFTLDKNTSWMDRSKLKNWNMNLDIRSTSVTGLFQNMMELENISEDIQLTINSSKGTSISNTFNRCFKLRRLPMVLLSIFQNDTSTSAFSCFSCCQSLREIPPEYIACLNKKNKSGLFNTASALEEIRNLPIHDTYTSNGFGSTFNYTERLKALTFATNNGVPYTAEWKAHTIDLSGWIGCAYDKGYNLKLGAGEFTDANRVTDDASYQALKDSSDWWTDVRAYCRYNHDSAVETINSLPDTSAYLAANGGTNTIKFRGEAGSKTDGGAINTLTAEEIAVATAKGWTVTLV
jgi:hypothetical protein